MVHLRSLSRIPAVAGVDDAMDFVDLLRSILSLFRQANEVLGIPLPRKGE